MSRASGTASFPATNSRAWNGESSASARVSLAAIRPKMRVSARVSLNIAHAATANAFS